MFKVSFDAKLGAFTQSGPNPVYKKEANGSLVSGRADEVGPFGIELELQAYTAEALGAPQASILAEVKSTRAFGVSGPAPVKVTIKLSVSSYATSSKFPQMTPPEVTVLYGLLEKSVSSSNSQSPVPYEIVGECPAGAPDYVIGVRIMSNNSADAGGEPNSKRHNPVH